MKLNWKHRRIKHIALVAMWCLILGYIIYLHEDSVSRQGQPGPAAKTVNESDWTKPERNKKGQIVSGPLCGSIGYSYTSIVFKQNKYLAESGDTDAQHAIGSVYAQGDINPCDHGLDIKQDFVEAYFWLSLAAKKEPGVVAARDEAAKHLTPEQITAVNERVAKWKPTFGSASKK